MNRIGRQNRACLIHKSASSWSLVCHHQSRRRRRRRRHVDLIKWGIGNWFFYIGEFVVCVCVCVCLARALSLSSAAAALVVPVERAILYSAALFTLRLRYICM